MSDIAESQLLKVRGVSIPEPEIDSNGNKTYHIKQVTGIMIKEGHAYKARLNPRMSVDGGMPTLQSNWNRGTFPHFTECMADVGKVSGNYIYATCLGGSGIAWEGWIPVDSIEILEEL